MYTVLNFKFDKEIYNFQLVDHAQFAEEEQDLSLTGVSTIAAQTHEEDEEDE